MRSWLKSGAPWVWLTAAAVSVCIIVVVGLLGLIAVRGMGHFWPSDIMMANYQEPGQASVRIIGEVHTRESVSIDRITDSGIKLDTKDKMITRYLIKTGNRDVSGQDFRWMVKPLLSDRTFPTNLMTVERLEWGNFYGSLQTVMENHQVIAKGDAAWKELQSRITRADELHRQIRSIERGELGTINGHLERLRLEQRKLEINGENTPERLALIDEERTELRQQYEKHEAQLATLYTAIGRDSFQAEVMDGQVVEIPISKVVRAYLPNAMNPVDKASFYAMKVWEFLSEEPREANTEGGIFPAIFGTVILVMIMSLMVTPFGVIAAVYLREYAKQGLLTRIVRIAVNNLAGVPSIVYGVFGLGFFVYFLGGSMDALFFPEAAPAPVFGTPGMLWSSITLALLTVPVVIVATEEGLSRIPRSIREGSLALGATKAETLWRTVIPMASPAIMTGMILAVARAAGEVAPLMLVGVVKLAPSLPIDSIPPYLHLDRKFMHLGFHIHDVGFQSPNIEAARPLVYATAFLLVLVVILLNLAAIAIRNRLREKYRSMEH
jgi:phosphate transport system permease protein